MMSDKLNLIDITLTGSTMINAINTNNDRIEQAMEKTLSRDGTTPNSMESNLDMNSNRILNLPIPHNSHEPVTVEYFDAYIAALDPDQPLPSDIFFKSADDSNDIAEGDDHLFMTPAERTKLSGIETAADVTDATNVGAAGAIMDTDFSSNGHMIRTASGSYTSRSVAAGTGVAVTNGSGVSGNPTVALDSATQASLLLADSSLQDSDIGNSIQAHSTALDNYPDPTTSDGDSLGTSTKQWSDLFLAAGGVINWNNGDVTATHSDNALSFAGASTSNGYNFDALLKVSSAFPRLVLVDSDTAAEARIDANSSVGGLFIQADFNNAVAGSYIRFDVDGTALVRIGDTSPSLRPETSNGVALGSTSAMWSDLFLASGGVINWSNGDITLTHASNALTGDGGSFTWRQSNAASPQIKFENYNNNANSGVIDLYSNNSTPAANDILYTSWNLNNAAGEKTSFAVLQANASTITDGAEYGRMQMRLMENGTLVTCFVWHPDYFGPWTGGAATLGTSNFTWGGAYFSDGATLNFNSGNITVTHANGYLTTTSAAATMGVFKSTGSTAARIAFQGSGTTSATTVMIGAVNDDLVAYAGGSPEVLLTTTSLSPYTSDGSALGTTSKMWSDLFLANGGVVNFNNGNATITHSSGLLTSSVDFVVPDEAYDATNWNGSLEVPTKNAVRDYLETLTGTTLPATYQPLDADLTAIGALAKTDGNIIVGNGTTWVAESGATARTSLGVGSGDSPSFTGLNLSAALLGLGDIRSGASSAHYWSGRAQMRSPADGQITVRNAANSAYGEIRTKVQLETDTAPASATATGTAGQIRYDSNYIYICTATDTWRRVAHSTW